MGQAFGKRVLDDRWHSGVRFWEGDDADINIEKYRRPAWLEGVLTYQEGMQKHPLPRLRSYAQRRAG